MVAATAVLWVLISAVAHVTRPLIPEDVDTSDITPSDQFLQPRASAPINWRDLSDEAFQESRRTDRPVLLVMGTGFSPLAKKTGDLFAVPEVAEAIRKSVIPVSLDLEELPGWRDRFLALTNRKRGDKGWLQIYLLDYEGQVVLAPSDQDLWSWNDNQFLRWLTDSRLAYIDRGQRPLQSREKFDRETLTKVGNDTRPDVSGYLDRYVNRQGRAEVVPQWFLDSQGLLAIQEAGRWDDLQRLLGPLSRSNAYDVLYGGFFFNSGSSDWTQVEYTKVLPLVGDMTVLMASLGATDDFANSAAENCFEYLASVLTDPEPWTFERSKQDDMGRSLRYCFSPRRLRGSFPPTKDDLTPREQNWAKNVLGLDVGRNPQMSCRVEDPEQFLSRSETGNSVLRKLKEFGKDGEIQRFGTGMLARRAYSVARLAEASRALGKDHQTLALQLFSTLKSRMRVGHNEVYGFIRGEKFGSGNLDAYLSYADAAMQAFFISGDQQLRRDAIAVFERGTFLYSAPNATLSATEPLGQLPVFKLSCPNVFDGTTASLQAQAILLLASFAKTESDGLKRREYLDRAERYLNQVSEVVDEVDWGIGGLVRAALVLEEVESAS